MRVQDDERPVVVGFDGSPESRRALRWGADEARLRFLPLVVCHAWQWPYHLVSITPGAPEIMERVGRHVLDTGLAMAQDFASRSPVRGRLVEGSAAGALVGASGSAEMVVIGPRGAGGFQELRIGATTAQLVAHAHCPVAVVREPVHPRADRVTIGVDGGNLDPADLGLAFEEARLRRAALLVICLCPEGTEDTRRAAVRFHTNLGVWEEKYPQVNVETVVETRPHPEVLRHAADRSDLLIVPNRERDDPAALPIGPVCQALLREAPCTLVVTPSHVPPMAGR
ncbi:nucleotide-binding universal stress UspA family protein [Streptosporangium becharense]|uniref:Nucleotide-binding universal stress UspA family protein n=1 Tax=Streptosporangium becharense TaxID=1816182 RepID=A0A7W9IL04_9ACTN|nr:universal stress protein [Streptosporangium becharense]MBB2911545.1 nucleotide-binding universal stress UspA family protein [Streptosporangium becharense]MBB5822637.1 nucleotide-binding universal stress UspA family protein [Streptosporangium becharense]